MEVLSAGPTAEQERRLRRQLRRVGVLVVAAVVAVGGAKAAPELVRWRPVQPRVAGEWRFRHEVEPAGRWEVASRSVATTSETTRFQTARGVPYCDVTVHTAGAFPTPRTGRAGRVHGHAAFLVPRPGGGTALAWTYADRAWATAGCQGYRAYTEADLFAMARAVRFHDSVLLLPYRLDALPPGYAVELLTEVADRWVELRATRPAGPGDHLAAAITLGEEDPGPASDPASASPTPLEVDGRPATLTGSGRPVLCLDVRPRHLCATYDEADDDRSSARSPDGARAGLATLRRLAADLHLAADPDDRSTWVDARDALPG